MHSQFHYPSSSKHWYNACMLLLCHSFWTHNMTKNMRALLKSQLITVLHVHVCQFQDAYEIGSLQVKHNSQLLLPVMFCVLPVFHSFLTPRGFTAWPKNAGFAQVTAVTSCYMLPVRHSLWMTRRFTTVQVPAGLAQVAAVTPCYMFSVLLMYHSFWMPRRFTTWPSTCRCCTSCSCYILLHLLCVTYVFQFLGHPEDSQPDQVPTGIAQVTAVTPCYMFCMLLMYHSFWMPRRFTTWPSTCRHCTSHSWRRRSTPHSCSTATQSWRTCPNWMSSLW